MEHTFIINQIANEIGLCLTNDESIRIHDVIVGKYNKQINYISIECIFNTIVEII